jgi:transcriptional regulator with XRE-family HTH domain
MKKLREFLERENMSISELAQLLGVTKNYVWMLLDGRNQPSVLLAKEIETVTKGSIKAIDILSDKPLKPRCPTCGHIISKRLHKKLEDEENL